MLSCVSMFFRICHRISSCLQPVACFIAFLPGEHAFLQVTPVACFPAFVIGCLFFPRLSLVSCFPAFVIAFLFSRVCHCLHDFPQVTPVFPRLVPVVCPPKFQTEYILSRALHCLQGLVFRSCDWFICSFVFVVITFMYM